MSPGGEQRVRDQIVGKRILVVEDEPIIAMSLEDMLCDLGCTVVGPALRIEQAEAMARNEPIDCAILDVNMGSRPTFCVAEILASRGISFCFSTGYGASVIPPEFVKTPILQKPYKPELLKEVLRQCLSARLATG